MYQNTIYICISWYSKICWFPVKKCWYQQNSRGVSRDSYIFLDLLWVRYNCAKFPHCRICLTDFTPPPIRGQPRKSPSWIGLNHQWKVIQKFFKCWNIWTIKTRLRRSTGKMWLQSETAIHTTKFAAKHHQKKNKENHLVQPTFQFKCKNKRGKNVSAINTLTFPSSKRVTQNL